MTARDTDPRRLGRHRHAGRAGSLQPARVGGLTVSYGEKARASSRSMRPFRREPCRPSWGRTGRASRPSSRRPSGLSRRVGRGAHLRAAPFGGPRPHRLRPQRASIDWDFPTTVIDVVLMGRYRKLGLFRRVSESRTRRWRKERCPRRHGGFRGLAQIGHAVGRPAAARSSPPARWRRRPISTCWTNPSPVPMRGDRAGDHRGAEIAQGAGASRLIAVHS